MEVFTNTPLIQKSRKMTLELILSNHRKECLTCVRNQNCELQKLARDFGLEYVRFGGDLEPQIEASTPHLIRDNSKCILCRRCVAVCKYNQDAAVIGANDRGLLPTSVALSTVTCLGLLVSLAVSALPFVLLVRWLSVMILIRFLKLLMIRPNTW